MPRLLKPGHEIVSGTIGMGKSYYVLYKIVKSFVYDRPCAYIDPKGDTYENLLSFFATTQQGRVLWEAYKDRILLLNPVTSADWMVSFNAIEPVGQFPKSDPDVIALLANSVVSHIRKQSGFEQAEANRMQNIMLASAGLLAEGGEGKLTLAELPLLFVPSYVYRGKRRVTEDHNPFVRSLLPHVRHPGTLSFWNDQWPTWTVNARREWVQSSEGRIFQYLFDQRLLMTVCAANNATLDFRRLIDEGYWLFVNVPYALLSDTMTTVLGNLIITKILYACMQRSVGEHPYRLILDEARFFNSGPLDVILETSRAYNLWLTLVVQNLDQLARMREGRVDLRLKEAVVNLCRYFCVFHNISDAELFARVMFAVTGQVPMGVKVSGDFEYLPVAAEENGHIHRFINLKHREMVFYDKLEEMPPRVWRTPEVIMDAPNPALVSYFEAAHLRRTGRPVVEIRNEIQERQAQIRKLLRGEGAPDETKRRLPMPSFGRW